MASSDIGSSFLGPGYPYWNNVRTPSEIGMSSDGTLNALGRDISGLKSYVELLVTGRGSASATGGPLGNKFFLKTGGQCNSNLDPNGSPVLVDRYMYINNIPQGEIPFISSSMGVNFTEFRGLIPGVMSDLDKINPFAVLQAFVEDTNPKCKPITMEIVGPTPPPTSLGANVRSSETHYVTLSDISRINPCLFPDRRNPQSGVVCRETFETMEGESDERAEKQEQQRKKEQEKMEKMRRNKDGITETSSFSSTSFPSTSFPSTSFPKDPFLQMYFVSLGLIGIYILYCLMARKRI